MARQEEKVGKSPKVGNSLEVDDAKYVSGLSTILVATIQEAKDRISQIEYIFCSQLFPNFQSKSKSLQTIYAEALQSAERTWKEKEDSLLLQMGKLRIDKEQLVQENQSLKVRIEELEHDLGQKIKEVDDGMELQRKLIRVVQSSESILVRKGEQLKEQKEVTGALLLRQRSLEKSVEGLKEELRQKTEEIVNVKQLEVNLLKKMEVQASEIFSKEQLLVDCEKEHGLLKVKSKCMEEQIVRLEEELREMNADKGEEARKSSKMQLKQHEEERVKLLCKVEDLEGRANDLQTLLKQKSCEADRLRHELQSAQSELLSEKKKVAELLNWCKNFKSQNNYLLKKISQSKSRGEEDRQENLVTTPCLENKNTDTVRVDYGAKVKDEIDVDDPVENEKDESLLKCPSPNSGEFVAPKSVTSKRSSPVSGTKRRASSWRDTRAHQSRYGPDPHDDFLDTPLENIRENLNNSRKDELGNSPNHEARGVDHGSLDDDETQDMNVDPCPGKQQAPAPSDGSRKSFKYVGAVRKKAEREALKGVECKQCKKFYDAVLPDNGNGDTGGNNTNIRCEHHDGVSRHRYKYVPPLTPEGFWNIGFESEM
ncbi:protein gamma response 1 [Punica granatum]|uniref:Uncharacterized protein n=2 Tax=Punica granatum TaxID=22663 RepID=A0A2I0IUR3_PUNGR|nr:protein gamma response 1 [Punica granatum]PKI47400.1 hypothetical protein CRG98_032235 [Punica granatum]